jgi:protein-S-isoprenylcysteine O-methyltransferase Ste14
LEPTDKIYYMRAILGILAGIIIAFSISPDTNQGTILGIIIIMSILFYIISYWISKKILPNVPKAEKRKFVTNGIFPFIFLLVMFMIVSYTGLHQNLAT